MTRNFAMNEAQPLEADTHSNHRNQKFFGEWTHKLVYRLVIALPLKRLERRSDLIVYVTRQCDTAFAPHYAGVRVAEALAPSFDHEIPRH